MAWSQGAPLSPGERGLTAALAEWIASDAVRGERAVELRSQRMLLDIVGVAIQGAQSRIAGQVRSVMAAGNPGRASIIGVPQRSATAAAIFSNAVAAHALELDDGYTPGSVHPSAAVFPAVLGAAERNDLSVGELLSGLIVGAEVTCRIAEAGHPQTYERGFHNTPLAGVIGAAAGVAHVLQLGADATISAIALASSHSGGLFEFLDDGSDVKRLHPAIAARDGWHSATLAEAGVTGPRRALEGRRGYFRAFAGIPDPSATVLDGLGVDWRVMDMYTKPHACCRALHAAVDALIDIKAMASLNWQEVERVTIRTYAKASEYSGRSVQTLLDAQLSMPTVAALALVFGNVGIPELRHAVDGGISSDDLDRVVVVHDRALDALYPPLRPVHVRVEARGEVFERYVDTPYGEPGNPMSSFDLEAKFRSLTTPVIGAEQSDGLSDTIRSPTSPVRELCALMAPSASATVTDPPDASRIAAHRASVQSGTSND